jgi:hypothetical protein
MPLSQAQSDLQSREEVTIVENEVHRTAARSIGEGSDHPGNFRAEDSDKHTRVIRKEDGRL